MKNSVSSLDKGLDILCCFDFEKKTQSAQSISERLNIPLSTTYRYLMTMEKRGFLARDPGTKAFKIGFMLFKMGNIVASQMKLVDIVFPHMKSLSALSGETVLLTVISGWEVICIEKVETNRLIKLSLERGSSLPLHAGASSKILLAYQEDSFIDSMFKKTPLTKFTDNSITDPIRLKKELKAIVKQGFSFSDQEVDLGARAIGAPVFDHKGKVVAGLTVAGPRERINDRGKGRLIQLVKETAKRASHDFGYKEPH